MSGWSGAGVFTRIYNWVNDANAAVPITASRMDAEDDGFATGLNNCLTKNGENSATANLPMATFKHTGVGNAAARNQYLAAGQQQDNDCIYGVASGTDTYTLTPTPAITAYAAGQEFIVNFTNANTSTCTLAVSGLTAKALQKGVSTALAAGDILAGQLYRCRYDGTRFVIVGKELDTSATSRGIVELATDAETVTGTDTARACTPANITAKMAAPGPIGGTTPAAVTCTTITASGAAQFDGAVTLGNNQADVITCTGYMSGLPRICYNSADQTTTSSTPTNATGLSFSLTSGVYYEFEFVGRYETSNTAGGIAIGLTIPSIGTRDFSAYIDIADDATASTARAFGCVFASGNVVTSAATASANTAYTFVVKGTIKPSAGGTLQLQFASENNTATITLHEGCFGKLWSSA